MAVIRPPRRTPPIFARPSLQSTPTSINADGVDTRELGSAAENAAKTTRGKGASNKPPKSDKGKKGGNYAAGRRRILLDAGGGIGYGFTRLATEFTTQSLTDVPVTDFEIPASAINSGEDYILWSMPLISNWSSSNTLQNFSLFNGGTLIPESDVTFEARNVSNINGRTMGFMRQITADGAITAKANVNTGTQTLYVHDESALLMLNVNDLGDNLTYAEDTTGVTLTVLNQWDDTGVEITFGDGAADYLLSLCVHWECNEGRQSNIRLTDGVTNHTVFSVTPQDITEERTQMAMFVMEAPAAGTWKLQAQQTSAMLNTPANKISFSSMCAIDTAAFGQAIVTATNPNAPVFSTANNPYEATAPTELTTGGDFLAIGTYLITPGTSTSFVHDLTMDIDGTPTELVDDYTILNYDLVNQLQRVTIVEGLEAGTVLTGQLNGNVNDTTQTGIWSSIAFLQLT